MSVNNIKDSNSTFLYHKFKDVAEKDGAGVEYMWGRPDEAQASRKRSYVKKVLGQNVYIGCGYYVD